MKKYLPLILTLLMCAFSSLLHAQSPGLITDQASDIVTDTSGFGNNLSSSDNDVQKALDTLDGLGVVDDTTPQLGGDLDVGSNTITSSSGLIEFLDNLKFEEIPNCDVLQTDVIGNVECAVTIRRNVAPMSVSQTLNEEEYFVVVNTTGGDVTITLPSTDILEGIQFIIKKEFAENTLTIQKFQGAGIEHGIDTDPFYVMTDKHEFIKVIMEGHNWWIIAKN